MGIFADVYVEVNNVTYSYSKRMHIKINSYAFELYKMIGYTAKEDFDFLNSSHPTERLMYSMALNAYIKFKKVKPSEIQKSKESNNE